jgi:hypothetical protein
MEYAGHARYFSCFLVSYIKTDTSYSLSFHPSAVLRTEIYLYLSKRPLPLEYDYLLASPHNHSYTCSRSAVSWDLPAVDQPPKRKSRIGAAQKHAGSFQMIAVCSIAYQCACWNMRICTTGKPSSAASIGIPAKPLQPTLRRRYMATWLAN